MTYLPQFLIPSTSSMAFNRKLQGIVKGEKNTYRLKRLKR